MELSRKIFTKRMCLMIHLLLLTPALEFSHLGFFSFSRPTDHLYKQNPNALHRYSIFHVPEPIPLKSHQLKQQENINSSEGGNATLKTPYIPSTFNQRFIVKISVQNISKVTYLHRKKKILTHTPWQHDPECARFKTHFGQGLPKVYLVSFPRSGNSWTRYLVEGATGIFTNSVYHDKSMRNMGYLGEMERDSSGRCILTKTHSSTFSNWRLERRRVHIRDDEPVILLLRNPATAMISFWNFKNARTDSFFWNVNNKTYSTPAFHKFVTSVIPKWKEVAEDRLIWSKRLLVVAYEELREYPLPTLERILEFLQQPMDGRRMECLTRHLDGPAKGQQRQIDPYSQREKALMTSAIMSISGLAHLRGYQLPNYTHALNLNKGPAV
ncbi:unnamed protein product, partial [Meganyctiphanes norvegica]